MPLEREVAFLAVDEIQLGADPERGHVFTDRLLHARGRDETMFLGADTIRPLLKRLVPEAEVISRPRFSDPVLRRRPQAHRLPRRSAVVAFSAAEVYALAELIRRQRGGAAVVLGALSPRTRNAQVALYQAGEVEYLVATDAIGMGLNMDVDHVAFAEPGQVRRQRAAAAAHARDRPDRRPRRPPHAGRHLRHHQTWAGSTPDHRGDRGPRLPAAAALRWRSSELDFGSLEACWPRSTRRRRRPACCRSGDAVDHVSLGSSAARDEMRERAATPGAACACSGRSARSRTSARP